MSINGSVVTSGGVALSDVVTAIESAGISGITSAVVDGKLEIYSTGADVVLADNSSTLLSEIGLTAGTYKAPKLTIAPHTQVPGYKSNRYSTQDQLVQCGLKLHNPNKGANWQVKVWNDTTKLWETKSFQFTQTNQEALYGLDKTGGGLNLPTGDVFVKYNVDEATDPIADFKIYRRGSTGATTIKSNIITTQLTAGTYAFNIAETAPNSSALGSDVTVSVTTTAATSDADLVAGAINSAGFTNVVASVDPSNRIVIEHNDGGDFHITDTGGVLGLAGFTATGSNATQFLLEAPSTHSHDFIASNWVILTVTNSTNCTNFIDNRRYFMVQSQLLTK